MIRLAEFSALAREFRLHPLGFFYFQQVLDAGKSRRVHVWLGPAALPANDRHQHSFDIRSTVVAGSMRSELFRFRELADGPTGEYRVSYEHGRSLLLPTGRVGTLDRFCIFDSVAGTEYVLSAGVIHRVSATATPCVTIVETTERSVPIFSYGNQVEEPPFARRLVTADEAHSIQQILLE